MPCTKNGLERFVSTQVSSAVKVVIGQSTIKAVPKNGHCQTMDVTQTQVKTIM